MSDARDEGEVDNEIDMFSRSYSATERREMSVMSEDELANFLQAHPEAMLDARAIRRLRWFAIRHWARRFWARIRGTF